MTAYGIDYSPVAGDNTAALNAAIAAAASGGQALFLPPGVVGISGQVVIPSGVRIFGYDRSVSTIQKISGSPAANMLVTQGGGSEIVLGNFTVDGNSQNQAGPFFPVGLSAISRVTIDRLQIVNPWATTLWINGSDDPAYRPAPDGTQINFDISVSNCIFDGTNQRDKAGDMVVVGRARRGLFKSNRVLGAGANMLALQFLAHFNVRENFLSNFWRGIYLETCQFTSVSDNDLDTLISAPAPSNGDNRAVGIWATTANESYLGSGYDSCRYLDITHNRISNLVRSSGSTGIAAIAISGAGGNLYAVNNRVERNIIAGGYTQDGKGYGIAVEGGHDGSTVDGNSIWGFNGAIRIGDAYAGGQSFSNVAIKDNVAEACNVFGLSAVGANYGQLSLIGNRMAGCANSISGAIPSTGGYLNVGNQGF